MRIAYGTFIGRIGRCLTPVAYPMRCRAAILREVLNPDPLCWKDTDRMSPSGAEVIRQIRSQIEEVDPSEVKARSRTATASCCSTCARATSGTPGTSRAPSTSRAATSSRASRASSAPTARSA